MDRVNPRSADQPLILLHGLGQTSADWASTVSALPGDQDVRYPYLFGLLGDRSRTYRSLVAEFEDYCGAIDGPVRICGLSLGGTIALDFAQRHPEKVSSLVLVGAQFKIPAGIMKVQNLVFRLLPNKFFNQMGISKADMISVASSMVGVDLGSELANITCPILVLCGSKDTANKKAAIALSEQLPNAELHWVEGAGHEVNKDKPQQLATLLNDFHRKHISHHVLTQVQ